MKIKMLAIALSTIALASFGTAEAAEPGFVSPYTQGSTIGVPKAMPMQEPFLFALGMDHYETQVFDDHNNSMADKYKANAATVFLMWAPGFELLGGQYRTGIAIPFLNVNADKVNPLLGPTGEYHEYGIGNVQFTPVDISWNVGQGLFASAGLNVFTPWDSYDKNKTVAIGSPIWIFEPNIALSYVTQNGWMASVDAHYAFNTKNRETDYQTGNQFFATAWVTKQIGRFALGPAIYYGKQVTGDSNTGSNYYGLTFNAPENFAVGAVANIHFDNNMNASLFYTHDVVAENSSGGNRFWFRLSVPFGK